MILKAKQRGFTLIELIVFIVVIGITATALLLSLQVVLARSPNVFRQTVAMNLAQERMELILGQKYLQGFGSFSDPCNNVSPPDICTMPTGYAISASISNTTINSDSNYKTITVVVSGLGDARLTTLVANTG